MFEKFDLKLPAFSLTLFLASCQPGGSGSGETVPDDGPASPASVSLLFPTDGAKGIAQESTVRAGFSKAMDPLSLTPGSFQLYLGTGLSNQIPGSVSYEAASQTAIFTPTQKLKSGSYFTAVLTTQVLDAGGLALGAPKTWSFQVQDSLPPAVVATAPLCGTVNVPLTSSFCVEFSETLSPLTLLPGSVALFKETPSGSLEVPGSMEILAQGRTICFAPMGLLEPNTVYSLALSPSISDLDGNELGVSAPCSVTTLETVKPFVTEVFPGPSETKIKTDSVIRATLSEPLNPFTVGPDSLQLFDNTGAKVDGVLAFDDSTQTFTLTPAAKLKVYSSYSATISATIEDLAGNPMGSGPALGSFYSWNFQTVGWEAPVLVEHADGIANTANEPQSAVNPATGEVWAVWTQMQASDTATRIYSNTNPADGSWKTEKPISNGASGALAPQIAIGPSGNPWAVWVQKDPTNGDLKDNIYLSSFDGSAWSAQVRVSSDAADASLPRIVIDGDGIPYVAWLEKLDVLEGTTTKTYIVAYANFPSGDPATWGNKSRLSYQKGNVGSLDLAVDRKLKRVYAVFTQKNAETTPNDAKVNAYANVFETGAWAATPSKLSDDVNDASETKVLAFPSSGNALAVWLQKATGAGATIQPYASYFTGPDTLTGLPGSWAAQTKISDKSGACSQLRIAGSPDAENAVVAWKQKAGDTFENFWAAVFKGVWIAQKRIGDNKGTGDDLSLFFEPSSLIVYAAWLRQPSAAIGNDDQAARVYSSSLQLLQGTWEESLAVSPAPVDSVQVAGSPRIAAAQIGAGRRIVAIWTRLVSPAFLIYYNDLEGSSYQE